ncbi:LOW QUALITY PROTEIN: hypothetical protein Cgig2_007107 [Carnegiea gigantea]|uniref:Uncharacterized protein n=1 Tax=Carnegiea gigantea TaxID=171969 RepID=A0A9Q1JYE9_9CARY|nr:LOW QUALITY PROTEIN: hypothetical protein Cgig2_007107 [Carnegiea gigantea]
MAISSSITLGGFKTPEVTKSQDLTKSWTSESWAVGSALIKLVDGRWVIRVEPPAAWEAALTVLEGAGHGPQMTGSPIDEGPIVRLQLSPLAMEQRPRSRLEDPRSVAVFGPAYGRLLRAWSEGGCLQEEDSLWNLRITRKGEGTNKVVHCTFLTYWVTRRCLSSPRRRSASAATCSGVASVVSKIVNLALA